MKNLEKLISALKNDETAILLTSRVNRQYAAEFDIAEGEAIVSTKGCLYFTDSRYIESAQKNLKGFTVLEVNRDHTYIQRINDAIEKFGIIELGIEEDYMLLSEYNRYLKHVNAKLIPMQKEISGFRCAKEEWELDIMQKAQDITDQSFAEILGKIHAGMTEKQLAAELIYTLYKNGADNLSFDPIVVSGPNTSLPHGVPGERILQDGDFITMDFGVIYHGYCSDMTRTVALGHATEKMREVYETVLKAQAAGIAVSKAGVLGSVIDGAARKVIADAGYGAYFGHGYGHSVGIEIHEAPNCNPSGTVPMPVNAVVSAEPGIYLPGEFGVRIEDVVVMKEDGHHILTKSPKSLIVV